MEKLTEQDGMSLNVVNENLKALKNLFPEALTEEGVDFEVLKQLLGDEVSESEEKFGLNWFGKMKSRQIAMEPSMGTLRPCFEESIDWDTTQNLFIEGDNLEVLKVLQKSYSGKVKMIYIDPPYNTGKDFIYPDNFQDNLDTYLKYTGQKSDEGLKVSSNTESSGRFHTNWLNMMYPRIKLAKNLLRYDGVLFISIDDAEQPNLRKICDEVFGENNLVANVVWRSKDNSNNDAKRFSTDHNHIVVYAKSADWLPARVFDESKQSHFKNPDNDPRGPYFDGNPLNSPNFRENLIYDLVSPSGNTIKSPKNGWRWSKAAMKEKMESGEIRFNDTETGIRRRTYLADQKGLPPSSLWIDLEKTGHNRQAKYEILKLFGEDIFDTPKPTRLIEYMMNLACIGNNDLVLDFFAGSSSSAHAVLNYAMKSKVAVRYIMVQLPELIDEDSDAAKAGFKHIAEIGRERIKRTVKQIKNDTPDYSGDLGFKVFKLASSNIVAWNPDKSDLEQTLIGHTEHLVPGRSEQDVLYELLLKRGVELTVPIEEKDISGKTVYSIGYGTLFVCLDKKIERDQIEALAQVIIAWHMELDPMSETQVVFRDSAFENDVAKTNITAILEQGCIKHVRSL
ncbi:site-specific DNA-methyltransferase [Desulfovibrio sp. QI0442]